MAVRLRGKAPNVQGIGAKIKLFGGAVPVQSQEIVCGGRYLSGDDPMRVFAAGSLTNRMRLEVTWRNGQRSVVENVPANSLYEIDEGSAQPLRITNHEPRPKKERRPSGRLSRLQLRGAKFEVGLR